MELSLFNKYQLPTKYTRVNAPYEVAKLFVIELNKTAGQEYVTKSGKKGKTKFYTEIMVMNVLKAINKDEGTMMAFFSDCERSEIGFRRYYCWKLKTKS